MTPMRAQRLLLGTLLAADATSFAPAALANKVALIKAAFNGNEDLIATDLTRADFTGSGALGGVVGAQQTGLDPATGQQIITLIEPLGGWRWVTTNAANLPQTIFGYAVFDSTLATLLAVNVFLVPISLTASGQVINLGTLDLTINPQPIS